MELMGIVIVVLLVTLGIFFAIKYQPGSGTDVSALTLSEDQQMASNMIGAVMRTSSQCQNQRFHALFQDCGGLKGIYCGSDSYGCSGDSCSYLKCTMQHLLNDTLDVWGKNYAFSAYTVGGPDLGIDVKSAAECTKYGKPAIQPLPLGNGGTIFVKLLVCSKAYS
jgi:hypothetical protein